MLIDNPGAGDSTLVMVDGMYFASRTAANVDIFELERVEVVRSSKSAIDRILRPAAKPREISSRSSRDNEMSARDLWRGWMPP